MISHNFFVCDCETPEHHIVVSQYTFDFDGIPEEDNPVEITLGVHLQQQGFLRRLVLGLRYIFGIIPVYTYGETILTEGKARAMAKLILEKVGAEDEDPN